MSGDDVVAAMVVEAGVVGLSESLGIKLSNMRYDIGTDEVSNRYQIIAKISIFEQK